MLLLHTLNLLLVHLYALFSTIIPIFSPFFTSLYRNDIAVSTVEIKACYMYTCQSVDKLVRLRNLQVKV